MKLTQLGAALMTGLLAFSAEASNLGYTMLGVDLTRTKFDDDVLVGPASFSSISGASLYGSYQLNDYFFLQAAGGAQSDEELDFEITESVGSVGAGFALPLGTQTDVVLRMALVSVDVEVCYDGYWGEICASDDDDGYASSAGVRHMVTQNVEVNADYTHVELDDFEDSDILTLGAAYWFAGHHSVRLRVGDTDDATTTALGYRYTF